MSDERKTLVPVEQREVSFYGDSLTAVRSEDGRVYAVIAHMCDALGIDTQAQTRRIRRTDVLERGHTWVAILTTQDDVTQRRRAQALRVDLVPLWLAGISTASLDDDDAREKLTQYQQEAADVLWEAFQEGRLTADPSFSELMEDDTPAVQTYKMLQAMTRLARQQVIMEARFAGRLDVHDERLEDHEARLEELEVTFGHPDHIITPSQAMQISQAVKAIAYEFSKRSGQNEYGGVYGELYRRFEITSYKLLPANRFDEAMDWLTEWYLSITGGNKIPF